MTQSDVLDFLEKHKREKFTVRQISELMGEEKGHITNNCGKLRDSGQVCWDYVQFRRKNSVGWHHVYWIE